MSAILKGVVLAGVMALGAGVFAQDWPQWRGPNRDAKVTGFKAPKTWPKELTQKWKITVGEGVASPALVGDKLFVYVREGKDEILRCLDAGTGKEHWAEKYETKDVDGAAARFPVPGPRSSPTVSGGKVVTLTAQGSLACYEADSGKLVWRKDDYVGKGNVPPFYASSSPIVVGGLCIAQLGGGGGKGGKGGKGGGKGGKGGVIVAYELSSGKEKWKWTSDGTAYASPALLKLGESKFIVAVTAGNIVALSADDGSKPLWKTPFTTRYNASSPMVEGDTVIFSGPGTGTKAVKLEKKGEEVTATEVWSNKENGVMYNTPVLRDGLVYGISDRNRLFCISTKDGKTAWTAAASGGSGGYGTVVDAGSVLFALTPGGQLLVFEPSDTEYKELAKYPVGKDTYTYPVVAGNRIYIKDRDSISLWTIPE